VHDDAIWPMMRAMHRTTLSRILLVATAVFAMGFSTLAADEADDLALDDDLVAEVIDVLEERYVDEAVLTQENLSVGAIRGMVEALGDDGHTEYLTEEEYKIEQEVLQGRVAGIGVVLDQRSSAPIIISVVDGSPAARAGLRAGDIIVAVDGTETARLPLDELGHRVRGDPGTVVRLGIERPGEFERDVVSLRREEVEIDPVVWAMAPGSDVAVVRVVQFSIGAGHQLREAVADALDVGATGFVVDLRGNPGGLVEETLNAASAFLDDGVVFLEQARDETPTGVRVDPGRAIAADVPVIVLVDYGTASSGEILAAALRDNGLARIVGEQTFGTGTILNTLRLSDGSALRLGVREWLTPDGASVFRVGLTPDEPVTLPIGATRLDPGDLLALAAYEFESSEDVPLRHAVRMVEAEARP
jgi:carboxyl-terminal processing protease